MHVIDFALCQFTHQGSEVDLAVFSGQFDHFNTLTFKVLGANDIVACADQQRFSALENLQVRIETQI